MRLAEFDNARFRSINSRRKLLEFSEWQKLAKNANYKLTKNN